LVELCIHVANILYLASFLGRDMLWLRILTCGGLVLGIVFFSCQPAPMYGPSAWHILFLLINAVQIRRLIVERRRLMLTDKQERIGEATFHDLSRDELLNLLTHVMAQGAEALKSPDEIQQTSQQPLSRQEAVLRDIAFNHLSRADILNLLTRRMWNAIVRLKPARRSRAGRIARPAEKVA
jgi:hypothetical protein